MSADKDEQAGDDSEERTRDRSPQFPFIGLQKAIDRARELEAEYKKSSGRVANVLAVWQYTAKSSGGAQTIAALKAFGLVEDEGSRAERKIKLTERAHRILKDERPGKREEAIREAALKPKAIQEHWILWGFARPPDAECRSELTLERGYSEDAAARFLRVYDDTLKFANLAEGDKVSDKATEEEAPKIDAAGRIFDRGLNPPPKVRQLEAHLQDVFNIDEGQAVVQWPASMSSESYQDFVQWLEIIKRKIKRQIDAAASAEKKPEPPAEPSA